MIGWLIVGVLCFMAYYVGTHPEALASLGLGPTSPKEKTEAAVAQTNAPGMTFIGCYKNTGGLLTGNTHHTATPNMCAAMAKRAGMRYMGLQNPTSDGSANCMMTNDLNKAKSLGAGTCSGAGRLGGNWVNALYDLGAGSADAGPGTGGGTGTGKLVGCFGDGSVRAMTPTQFGKTQIAPERCAAAARALKHRYMGLQNPDSAGNSTCYTSNNWLQTIGYGNRVPCPAGGASWVNAVYDLNA